MDYIRNDLPPAKKRKIHHEKIIQDLKPEKIKTISDLIKIGEEYKKHLQNEDYSPIQTNLDLFYLKKIIPELKRLDNLVGMKDIKESLLNQLIYFLESLENEKDSLHTCIYGNPGTGKTTVGEIIGKIYCKLGLLEKGHFTIVTRDMLVGQYLGQTAPRTKKVLESCLGGVMFLDEAYQMSAGSSDRIDQFSKECLDTINQFLLEHRKDFICIIAGYKNEVQRCFFDVNKGLERRFPWKFEIKDYTPEEMSEIFIKQIKDANWKLADNVQMNNFFEKNKEYFKNNGGDTEILLTKIKIAHSKRIINLSQIHKRVIDNSDIKNGFELYINDSGVKELKKDNSYSSMYL